MFDLPMKASAADLAAVPVPLAGRVMMFAGQGGAPMVRTPDGAFRGFRGYSGLWLAQESTVAALGAGVHVAVLSCPMVAGQAAAGALVPVRLAWWHKPAAAGTLSVVLRVNGGAWGQVASIALTASATSKRSFMWDGVIALKAAGLYVEGVMLSSAQAAPVWGEASWDVPVSSGVDVGLVYTVAMAAGELGVRSVSAGVLL